MAKVGLGKGVYENRVAKVGLGKWSLDESLRQCQPGPLPHGIGQART